ncbi:MAG TPA: sensor histidine kinase [Rhizomicrobium sp.]|jgi:two-component sensor histidine kinase
MNAMENSLRLVSNTDMLAEANHRIANHLALLAGMVQLQASAVAKGPDLFTKAQVRGMLQETAGKIVGIGNMHRRFAYRAGEQELDLATHLIESTHQLVSHLSLDARVTISERLERNCTVTPEQAQTIVLIAGEIVMNAVKHAHPTGLPVAIAVCCARNADDSITVEVGDDGVGFPEDFDAETGGGLGLRLIRSLAQKINATLQIESDALGLSYRLRIPPHA